VQPEQPSIITCVKQMAFQQKVRTLKSKRVGDHGTHADLSTFTTLVFAGISKVQRWQFLKWTAGSSGRDSCHATIT